MDGGRGWNFEHTGAATSDATVATVVVSSAAVRFAVGDAAARAARLRFFVRHFASIAARVSEIRGLVF